MNLTVIERIERHFLLKNCLPLQLLLIAVSESLSISIKHKDSATCLPDVGRSCYLHTG